MSVRTHVATSKQKIRNGTDSADHWNRIIYNRRQHGLGERIPSLVGADMNCMKYSSSMFGNKLLRIYYIYAVFDDTAANTESYAIYVTPRCLIYHWFVIMIIMTTPRW